jgi:cytoskeletal protein CcmA (bactofilin family)
VTHGKHSTVPGGLSPTETHSRVEAAGPNEMQVLGRWTEFRGELIGRSDLRVDGTLWGVIRLEGYRLIVGLSGRVDAEIHARSVIVRGCLRGSVTAEDRVEVLQTGELFARVRTRRLVFAEGARFRGEVDKAVEALVHRKPPHPSGE